MAGYSIFFRSSASRELKAIPKKDLQRIIRRIRALASDPRPAGSEKLSGRERYRVRQGDYRVVYALEDSEREVHIVKVGHRRASTVGDLP